MPTIRNRMTPDQIARVRKLHDQGMGLHEIAAEVGQGIQWCAIRLYASGVESPREREKKEALLRRFQVVQVEAQLKSEKRRCIGDLNESVDKAYWRVCG